MLVTRIRIWTRRYRLTNYSRAVTVCVPTTTTTTTKRGRRELYKIRCTGIKSVISCCLSLTQIDPSKTSDHVLVQICEENDRMSLEQTVFPIHRVLLQERKKISLLSTARECVAPFFECCRLSSIFFVRDRVN